jgi:CBS domain-containing protein
VKEIILGVVGDIMTEKVVTCTPSTPILAVRDLMGKHRISRIVVKEKNKPVSILTSKDIVHFLVTDRSPRSLEEIKTKEVMSKYLIVVKPNTSISNAAEMMLEKDISSLIVVGENGNLKGIVTKADLCSYLAYKGAGIYNVDDFMRKNPISVEPSYSIFSVAHLMARNKISRVVVTDKKNIPIGIITLTDLTMIGRTFKVPQGFMEGKTLLVGASIPGINLLTARDIMASHPISINKDGDLSDAAKLMTRHGISGLPVIDNVGRLSGIVTKTDITRAVASLE